MTENEVKHSMKIPPSRTTFCRAVWRCMTRERGSPPSHGFRRGALSLDAHSVRQLYAPGPRRGSKEADPARARSQWQNMRRTGYLRREVRV